MSPGAEFNQATTAIQRELGRAFPPPVILFRLRDAGGLSKNHFSFTFNFRKCSLPERREFARDRGIIIAHTKFEWGWADGELILIDEVLTPDSSRFWPAISRRVVANPLTINSSYETGWEGQPGTKKARLPRCRRRLLLRPGTSTWRFTKDLPVANLPGW